jgi:hypothetical protein
MIRSLLLWTAMNAPGDIMCGIVGGIAGGLVVWYNVRRRER